MAEADREAGGLQSWEVASRTTPSGARMTAAFLLRQPISLALCVLISQMRKVRPGEVCELTTWLTCFVTGCADSWRSPLGSWPAGALFWVFALLCPPPVFLTSTKGFDYQGESETTVSEWEPEVADHTLAAPAGSADPTWPVAVSWVTMGSISCKGLQRRKGVRSPFWLVIVQHAF